MPTCPAARRLSAAAACVLALLAVLVVAVLVVAPVVLARPAEAADRVITITADGVPGATTIAPGDTVTFVNGDPTSGRRYTPRSSSGNWTFSADEQPIDLSPGLGSGESYTVPDPLTAEGTYTFTVSRADPALQGPVLEGAVVVRRPPVPSPAVASGAPASSAPTGAPTSAPTSAPGKDAPGSGASGGGGPGGGGPGSSSPDSGAPTPPRPGPARPSAPSSSPTGGTGAVAMPRLGGIDGGAAPTAPLGAASGQAPAIALPAPEGLPALPGTAGAPAPQAAGEPTPTAVVAAAVPGDLPAAGSRRAYGLPAALAVVLAVGVASLLVRLLLAEPAARRVLDGLTGPDPVVTVD